MMYSNFLELELTEADKFARGLDPNLSSRDIENLYKTGMVAIDNIFDVELRLLLAKYWPRALSVPYNCIKLDSKFESGLPHTRGSSLMFPSDREISLETYVHEFVHVYQRARPDDVLHLVCDLWKYKKKETLDMSMRTSLNIRYNPDTDPFLYEDQNGQIHVTMYKDHKPKSLGETKTIALDSINKVCTIEPQKDVRKDHPFELMAYMIVDILFGKVNKYDTQIELCKKWMNGMI